ncbi:hypothetical protein ONZ45_g10570 [Pleurotus djamor]|nr:hypothetical protein ONZ45_g10570 [Pleurotus djamor]
MRTALTALASLILPIASGFVLPRQHGSTPTYEMLVQNVTIDNDLMTASPNSVFGTSLLGYKSFYLSGNWTTVVSTTYGFRGSYLWTSDPDARAELRFEGVAAYFVAPRFVGTEVFQSISVNIELDMEPAAVVDLAPPVSSSAEPGSRPLNVSTPASAIWGHAGLEYGNHTLVLTVTPGARYAMLDALVYTAVLDVNSSESSPSASSSSSSSSSSTLRIALSTSLSIVAALVILAVFLFIRRRRQQGKGQQEQRGLRRWVDMRWVNASRTNLGEGAPGVAGAGAGDVKGEAMRMEKL